MNLGLFSWIAFHLSYKSSERKFALPFRVSLSHYSHQVSLKRYLPCSFSTSLIFIFLTYAWICKLCFTMLNSSFNSWTFYCNFTMTMTCLALGCLRHFFALSLPQFVMDFISSLYCKLFLFSRIVLFQFFLSPILAILGSGRLRFWSQLKSLVICTHSFEGKIQLCFRSVSVELVAYIFREDSKESS